MLLLLVDALNDGGEAVDLGFKNAQVTVKKKHIEPYEQYKNHKIEESHAASFIKSVSFIRLRPFVFQLLKHIDLRDAVREVPNYQKDPQL